MSSSGSLCKLIDHYDIDIALLTEHKLLPQFANFCNAIHMDYSAFTETYKNSDYSNSYPCVKGGVSVLFKKSLQFNLNYLENISNDRISVIELNVSNAQPIFACCTYMPAANYSLADYEDCIQSLQALYDTYSEIGPVIIFGDLDAEYIRSSLHKNFQNNRNSLLTNLICTNNLVSCTPPIARVQNTHSDRQSAL